MYIFTIVEKKDSLKIFIRCYQNLEATKHIISKKIYQFCSIFMMITTISIQFTTGNKINTFFRENPIPYII
jgi:hypothetical protein